MILIVVIPKISTVFKQLKVNMPLPTKIMIFVSDSLLHYYLYIIAGFIVLTAGLVFLYNKKRKKIRSIFFSLPLISPLMRDIDLFKFTRSMHLLLTAGITITNALELAENMVIKPEIKAAIAHAKSMVYSGKPLSESFKEQRKIYQGTMIELTQAGERTGTLDESMKSISEYYDNKVSDRLEIMTALLEPVMLVVVAILVGSMMIAIIGPIYNLIGQIGVH